ncbi:uncharacterized protein BDV14DRAFT_204078 [Aspergillus stella-maris]|uniref:uncharacterized protein n=1 Tax=Aspergillus stella-maris TaxID=1810926 RepID=UPI003CCDB027
MAAELLSNIKTVRNGLPELILEHERVYLIRECHELIGALERPREAVTRIMQAVYPVAALTTAIEMGLIDATVRATSDETPITIKQLAKATSADPNLIIRLMRVLPGIRVFREVDAATFQVTPLAKALATDPKLKAKVIHLASHASAAAAIPEFLSGNGYSNPDDALDGPFQYAMRSNMHYVDYVESKKRLNNALNTMLYSEQAEDGEEEEEEEEEEETGGERKEEEEEEEEEDGDECAREEKWFDYYPVRNRLQVSSPQDLLLVHFGSNSTTECPEFRQRFLDLQGLVVWQEPSPVIRQHQDGVPPLPLIKNAKAYYTRPYFEDLPDRQLKMVLERIRDVMADNSVLLVADDNLLPESGNGETI